MAFCFKEATADHAEHLHQGLRLGLWVDKHAGILGRYFETRAFRFRASIMGGKRRSGERLKGSSGLE